MATSIVKDFEDAQKFPSRGFTTDNEIKVVNRLLTNAELLAMNATPVDLIDAPGANKLIVPISKLFMGYDYNGTVYVANDTIIKYDTSGDPLYTTLLKAHWEAAVDTVWYYDMNFTFPVDLKANINKKVFIKTDTSDFTGAGSDVRIFFLYQILTIV